MTKQQTMLQKLQELRKSDEGQCEKAKAELETRIADFEKSVKEIESKVKAN